MPQSVCPVWRALGRPGEGEIEEMLMVVVGSLDALLAAQTGRASKVCLLVMWRTVNRQEERGRMKEVPPSEGRLGLLSG